MSRHWVDISDAMDSIADERECDVDELHIDNAFVKHDDTLVLDVVEARFRE